MIVLGKKSFLRKYKEKLVPALSEGGLVNGFNYRFKKVF